MEGSKMIRFKSGGSPLEVNSNTTIEKGTENKGVFCENRCITYTLGTRVLSLNITQKGYADRVNNLDLKIFEKNGKGSSAYLHLVMIGNDRYGVLSQFYSKCSGSYDSIKDQYCVPPLPNVELFCYKCPETGSAGLFTLEKKVVNEVVGSVKATHAFIIGDETMNVKIKITDQKRGALNVEVEGPVKLTTDYLVHVLRRTFGKMNNEMDASTLNFYRNASHGHHIENRFSLGGTVYSETPTEGKFFKF